VRVFGRTLAGGLPFPLLATLVTIPLTFATAADAAPSAVWSCAPIEHHPVREAPALLRMTISLRRSADGSHDRYYPLSNTLSWSFGADGAVELRTNLQQETELPYSPYQSYTFRYRSLRNYACFSSYRTAALRRFLRVVRDASICTRARWSDNLGAVRRLGSVDYDIRLDTPETGACRTLLYGTPAIKDKTLALVKDAWLELEQSICGACQLPADAEAYFLPNLR
jgi:hypothetical protein